MKTTRRKEWFDDDSFWRDLYPFMFPEKRFADAFEQVDKALELTTPEGKSALDLCCGPGAQRLIAVGRKPDGPERPEDTETSHPAAGPEDPR